MSATAILPAPATPELQSFAFSVKLKGGGDREVTAFRRDEGAPWTIKPRVGGRQRWKSMGVVGQSKEDLALLRKRAQQVIQTWVDDTFAPPKPIATKAVPLATMGVLFGRYLAGASALGFRGRVETETAERNVTELRRVIRWARGSAAGPLKMADGEIDALPATMLTRELVDRFLKHYLADVETLSHEGRNELAVDRRSNGAANALRQAKSMFAKNKMELYAGLGLPDLSGFREAAVMPVQARTHAAIAPEVVARMHAAASGLRASNPRLWLIHTTLKHLGLRPSELIEAELGWLLRTSWGQWFLAIVVTERRRPKASAGYTPIAAEVAMEIMAVRRALATAAGETLTDESPLIPAPTANLRMDVVAREHSLWMRAFVPAEKYEGSNYELRRWAVQTIRRKYGKEASSDFARHAARDVTQQHYLERLNVWRDRCPAGNAGITWEDAQGATAAEQAAAIPASDWRGL